MSEYLSNIELYFTCPENVTEQNLIIDGPDVKHIMKVMRHKIGDKLFVTDGLGKIYHGNIYKLDEDRVFVNNLSKRESQQKFPNITVCIPNLKKSDRLEFALEKSTEMGITNFIVFKSKRSIIKKINIERLKKIVLSAMKQSLNSYLPKITVYDSMEYLKDRDKKIILFEQGSRENFSNDMINDVNNYFFVFGPEGGFEDGELPQEINISEYKLASNRLRTETAIVCAVSKLQN